MTEMSLSEYANQPKSAPKKQGGFPRGGQLVVGILIVAVLSFLAGMQYQKGKTPATKAVSATNSSQYGSGSGGPGGGFQRGDRAFGTVSAVSSTSITIQTRSGTTSTYTITSSTTVTNAGQSASVSDIQSGDTVIMTLDSSNTQDVSSIMLNPSFGGGFGGGSGGGGTGTSDSGGNDNTSSTNASGA
jgi:hypothetical protein